MYKKYFLAFLFLVFALINQNAFSQCTFAGFVTGAGTFPSISVAGPNLVAVFGGPNGSPQVFVSTNGGANFTSATGTGLGALELYCGWMTSATEMYGGNGGASGGAGGNASFYRTTDGGTTWSTVLSTGGTGGFFNAITFSKTTPTFGVAQSDPPTGAGQQYYFPVTTNGGANWSVTNPPGVSGAASAQNSVVVIDNQFYGFGLNAGASRVYYTSNGGSTWVIGNLGIAGSFTSGYAMSDNKMNGIAATNTSLPSIARTTDGGSSWSSVNITGLSGYATCKWIEGTNICYVSAGAGASGVIAKSTDGGQTFTVMTTAGLTGITHMEFYRSGNDIYGYAVAGDGSVLKLVDNVTGVVNNNTGVPTEYKLSQNYPNPFNPSTTINFSIPKASYVTLKVYDVVGKEVASIISRDLQAGNYTEQFVASSNLSSGVYFYQLIAGDFSQTKKFILNK